MREGVAVVAGQSEAILLRKRGCDITRLESKGKWAAAFRHGSFGLLRVTGVMEIIEDGDTVPDDAYTWSAAGLVRRTGGQNGWTCGWGCWTSRLRGITVTLSHGYDVMPTDLDALIGGAAQRLVDNPHGLSQQAIGPFSESYGATGSGTFTASDIAILSSYRLPRRP